jgi:hypothetical protein
VSVQLASDIATAKLGNPRSRFRGALIQPGDEAHVETRPVWNGGGIDVTAGRS